MQCCLLVQLNFTRHHHNLKSLTQTFLRVQSSVCPWEQSSAEEPRCLSGPHALIAQVDFDFTKQREFSISWRAVQSQNASVALFSAALGVGSDSSTQRHNVNLCLYVLCIRLFVAVTCSKLCLRWRLWINISSSLNYSVNVLIFNEQVKISNYYTSRHEHNGGWVS